MKTVSGEINRVIEGRAVQTAHTFEILVGGEWGSWLWTDWDEPIYHDDKEYQPFPIKMGSIKESGDGRIAGVTLAVANIDSDRIVQQAVEAYDVMGKEVIINQFFFDEGGNLIAESIDNVFTIRGARATKGQVDFKLDLGFDYLLATIPRRQVYRDLCRWEFKGAECGYSGDETLCQKSWEHCKVLGNISNFGGFPGIVSNNFFF